MDWLASGIANTFEFERIDVLDLDTAYGMIEGIVGGSVNESYRGDLRSGATLTFDGADLPLECLVRIWHTARLGDEMEREELGTFFVERRPRQHERGRYTGTASLQSTLYRLSTDLRSGNSGVSAGANVNARFESVVRNAGGTPSIPSYFDGTKTFPSSHVWEDGESVLSECHTCAASMSPRGYVMPDTHGRVTVERYREPSRRTPVHTLDSHVLLAGIGVDDPELVNSVVVSHTDGDTALSARADVGSTDAWNWRKVGRHATKHYTDSDAETQEALAKAAAQHLAELSTSKRTFSARALYFPCRVGDAATFEAPWGESIKVLIAQREFALDRLMVQSLTLEEI